MPSPSFDDLIVDPALHAATVETRVGYDLNGAPCDYESDAVVARFVRSPNQVRHWVKSRAFGAYAGSLYDPNVPGNDVASRRNGMPPFRFRQVNADAFASYLKFLGTKNPAHLRMAERNINL